MPEPARKLTAEDTMIVNLSSPLHRLCLEALVTGVVIGMEMEKQS